MNGANLVVERDRAHPLRPVTQLSANTHFKKRRLFGERTTCGTLHDARMAIDRQAPDLVLTDYRLPDGVGSELVKTMKGLCPVILLTSQVNEQVAVDAMRAGAHDYVVKSATVFCGMARIAQSGLRDWTLIQEQKRTETERQKTNI